MLRLLLVEVSTLLSYRIDADTLSQDRWFLGYIATDRPTVHRKAGEIAEFQRRLY